VSTAAYEIRDATTGLAITQISLGTVHPGDTVAVPDITIANIGTGAASILQLVVMLSTRAASGGTNAQGQEFSDEKWLQAREGAAAWKPIGGGVNGDVLDIATPPDTAADCDVHLQVVVPAGASTVGDVVALLDLVYEP